MFPSFNRIAGIVKKNIKGVKKMTPMIRKGVKRLLQQFT